MMFSSSAQEAEYIAQKEKLQYVQGNTASLCLFCPSMHMHTLVHPDVSQHSSTNLYLPLVSKVLMLLISFPEQEISHFSLTLNQTATSELSISSILIKCFTNTPHTQSIHQRTEGTD